MFKVFLVDDEVVVREGIRSSFPWEASGFVLAGEAPDGEIAWSLMQEIKPDILITDIRMPFMDGLTLAGKTAQAMPWVSTIILSGFDEFSYAKKAISLGVKEYLLKPVSALELQQALERISRHLTVERRQQADIRLIKEQLQLSSDLRREQLLREIMTNTMDHDKRESLLLNARKLDLNIVARHYRVMLIHPAKGEDLLSLRAMVQWLCDSRKGSIYLCAMGDSLAALLKGNSSDEMEEEAFGFAQAVSHQTNESVHVAIGAVVSTLFDLRQSFDSAQKVLSTIEQLPHWPIMDSSDLGIEIDEVLHRAQGDNLYDLLRYAKKEDLQNLLTSYFQATGEDTQQSILMMNYLYVDSVMTAARIIRESGKDPALFIPTDLQGQSNFSLFSRQEEMMQAAQQVLSLAFGCRDENRSSRYSNLILKAKAYIEERFSDQNLTLGNVAGQVNLSSNHFCTVFTQETGFTFIEYLTELRMQKARELLVKTELRSIDISEMVGYADSHYFSYLFKKTVGQSPRDYRSVHKNKQS